MGVRAMRSFSGCRETQALGEVASGFFGAIFPALGPLLKLAVRESVERLYTGEQEEGGSLGGYEILQCHGSIAGRCWDQELVGGIRRQAIGQGVLRVLIGKYRAEIVFLHPDDLLVELPHDAGTEKHAHQSSIDLVIHSPH